MEWIIEPFGTPGDGGNQECPKYVCGVYNPGCPNFRCVVNIEL